jgi:HK97 gp10 family phage protein
MPFISYEKRLDRWSEVIANFKPAVARIIGKVTLDSYARSQLTVPVRRPDVEEATGVTGGFLKASGQPDFHAGALEGEIRYTAYYAGYVHDGTVKMPARPFLRDAVESVVPSMLLAFRGLEGMLL